MLSIDCFVASGISFCVRFNRIHFCAEICFLFEGTQILTAKVKPHRVPKFRQVRRAEPSKVLPKEENCHSELRALHEVRSLPAEAERRRESAYQAQWADPSLRSGWTRAPIWSASIGDRELSVRTNLSRTPKTFRFQTYNLSQGVKHDQSNLARLDLTGQRRPI